MAVGDLTAEQQTRLALLAAIHALTLSELTEDVRAFTLSEIREALKRIAEAKGASSL